MPQCVKVIVPYAFGRPEEGDEWTEKRVSRACELVDSQTRGTTLIMSFAGYSPDSPDATVPSLHEKGLATSIAEMVRKKPEANSASLLTLPCVWGTLGETIAARDAIRILYPKAYVDVSVVTSEWHMVRVMSLWNILAPSHWTVVPVTISHFIPGTMYIEEASKCRHSLWIATLCNMLRFLPHHVRPAWYRRHVPSLPPDLWSHIQHPKK